MVKLNPGHYLPIDKQIVHLTLLRAIENGIKFFLC